MHSKQLSPREALLPASGRPHSEAHFPELQLASEPGQNLGSATQSLPLPTSRRREASSHGSPLSWGLIPTSYPARYPWVHSRCYWPKTPTVAAMSPRLSGPRQNSGLVPPSPHPATGPARLSAPPGHGSSHLAKAEQGPASPGAWEGLRFRPRKLPDGSKFRPLLKGPQVDGKHLLPCYLPRRRPGRGPYFYQRWVIF